MAAAKYEFDFDAVALFGCGRGLLTHLASPEVGLGTVRLRLT